MSQSMKYKVVEIFKSLQGEGFNTGKEVIFIRLSGCNLKCSFCDTEHEKFSELTINEIIKRVLEFRVNSVIITGGEPMTHNLLPLLITLKSHEFWIGMESNGTFDFDSVRELVDYITISPKNSSISNISNEVRVVNNNLTLEKLLQIEKNCLADRYFLSPLEQNSSFNYYDTIKLLGEINSISSKKWHLSLQMHKLIGIE